MANYRIRLPAGNPSQLSSWDGKVLLLCAPLTPTQNEWDRRHWSVWSRYKSTCMVVLMTQAQYALGHSHQRPFFERARLDIVRCSMGWKTADFRNVDGGAKAAIDCLIMPDHRRTGLGIVQDDSPEFLERGASEDRRRYHWGDLSGPGTWLILHGK